MFLQEIHLESEPHFGHASDGWRWSNTPSQSTSFKIAKRLATSLVKQKKGRSITELVIMTRGQYTLGGTHYHRKYVYQRGYSGFVEFPGDPDLAPDIVFKHKLGDCDPLEEEAPEVTGVRIVRTEKSDVESI